MNAALPLSRPSCFADVGSLPMLPPMWSLLLLSLSLSLTLTLSWSLLSRLLFYPRFPECGAGTDFVRVVRRLLTPRTLYRYRFFRGPRYLVIAEYVFDPFDPDFVVFWRIDQHDRLGLKKRGAGRGEPACMHAISLHWLGAYIAVERGEVV